MIQIYCTSLTNIGNVNGGSGLGTVHVYGTTIELAGSLQTTTPTINIGTGGGGVITIGNNTATTDIYGFTLTIGESGSTINMGGFSAGITLTGTQINLTAVIVDIGTGGATTSVTGILNTTGTITSSTGNIVSTLGSISAHTTVSAGTSISAGTSVTAGTSLNGQTLALTGKVTEVDSQTTAGTFGVSTVVAQGLDVDGSD